MELLRERASPEPINLYNTFSGSQERSGQAV